MEFLLIEDNQADIFLISMLMEECMYEDKLTVLTDGADALKFLTKSEPFKDVVIPDMLILDLNLPRKSGFEILKTIKEIDHLKNLQVVVLTSSENEKDKSQARQLGVMEYFSKPTKLSEYEIVVKSIFEIAHKHSNTA